MASWPARSCSRGDMASSLATERLHAFTISRKTTIVPRSPWRLCASSSATSQELSIIASTTGTACPWRTMRDQWTIASAEPSPIDFVSVCTSVRTISGETTMSRRRRRRVTTSFATSTRRSSRSSASCARVEFGTPRSESSDIMMPVGFSAGVNGAERIPTVAIRGREDVTLDRRYAADHIVKLRSGHVAKTIDDGLTRGCEYVVDVCRPLLRTCDEVAQRLHIGGFEGRTKEVHCGFDEFQIGSRRWHRRAGVYDEAGPA